MIHRSIGVLWPLSWRLWGILVAGVVALSACAKKDTVPVVAPQSSEVSNLRTSLPRIPYTIQLGAFESSLRAGQLVEQLKDEGIEAYFYEDKSGLIKVRFGRFDSRDDARKRAKALQAGRVIDDFYILQPNKDLRSRKSNPRNSLEKSLVKTAEGFIGIPYRWGGASVKKGFDCSGLTMTVYRLNGLDLPRKASSQFQAGRPVSRRTLKQGDLVFFSTNGDNRISHVGIYTGEGMFIHAPGRGKHIRTSSLSGDYYKEHYRGARRYF